MSRRMEATHQAQRQYEAVAGKHAPRAGFSRITVGFGVIWIIGSICAAWWIGSPYLRSANNNLDPVEVARVADAVQFSRDIDRGESIASLEKTVRQMSEELQTAHARINAVEAEARRNVATGTTSNSLIPAWMASNSVLVLAVAGAFSLLSMGIAFVAIRKLWRLKSTANTGVKDSESSAFASSSANESAMDDQDSMEEIHGDAVVEEYAESSASTSLHVSEESRVNDLAQPTICTAKSEQTRVEPLTRAVKKKPVPNPPPTELDFERIIAEMSLAQKTLRPAENAKGISPKRPTTNKTRKGRDAA